MNIEELKLVIEMVRQVSGDASNVALWYFVMKFAETIIILFTLVGAITWGVYQVIKANFGHDEQFIIECRDALGTGYRGGLINSERQATYNAIRTLIAKAKQ